MATKSIPAMAQTTAERAADAYRATDDAYKDVGRYLERLASDACKALVLVDVYAADHPASVCAPEVVEAARDVRDFLRLLVERMHELRRSRPQQAYDAVWQAAEAATAAAELEGQR